MMVRFFFLCITLLYVINNTFSQTYFHDIYTRFVNFNNQDGLSHNRINDIIQDNRGFMWFATEVGLNRFDGYEFIKYKNIPDDTLSIPGNIITSLSVDNNDNLWIGTTEGLCCLSLNTGKVTRYLAQAGKHNTPRTNHVRKLLFIESKNILWIETLEGTLTSYDISSGKWEHFSHTAVKQPYYRYHALFEDSNEDIWLGGRSTPLMKYEITTKKIFNINAKGLAKDGKRDNDLGDIIETSKGEWFVVGLDGIYQFFPENEKFNRIYATSSYSIVEDDQGLVWFGTGNGLVSLNTNKKQFTIYRNNQNNPLSLVNNHVNKVFIDRIGNIWLGTRNGISLLSRKNSIYSYYYNIPNYDLSLSSNQVTSMVQSNHGELYIGTANHGLNVWKPDEIDFVNYRSNPTDKYSLASDRISNLYFDRNGILWVGLWAGIGMQSYDIKTKCFTKYSFDPTSLKRDWYNAFLELSDDSFLVGFWGSNGATYFDRKNGKFMPKHYITFEKPYSRSINQIVNDGLGSIFFLTYSNNRIYRYDTKSNEYKAHATFSNDAFEKGYGIEYDLPYSFDNLTCMGTDGNGLTLFGTEKGLLGFEQGKGFFSFFQGDINPKSISFYNNDIYILEENSISIFNRKAQLLSKLRVDGKDLTNLKITQNGSIIVLDESEILLIHKLLDSYSDKNLRLSPFDTPNTIHDYLIDKEYIWLGTQNGLFSFKIAPPEASIDSESNALKILDVPVLSLVERGNGSMLCFSPLGIYNVCCKTKKIDRIQLINQPVDFSTAIQTAIMTSPDTVWVGNESGHYQIILKKGEVIETNLPENNRITSHLVSALLEDKLGNIWIGTTDRGLNKIDKDTGFITHFLADDNPYTLQDNSINNLMQSTDGRIWVATSKGLSYIESDFVFRYDGFVDQHEVFSFQEDSQGLIWVSTSKGLICINSVSGKNKLFDQSNGIPSINFTMASTTLIDGRIAWGTNDGFFLFNPNIINEDFNYGGSVYLTQFSVFGKPEKYHFSKSDTIKLHYSQNFFQINFSASDFGYIPGTVFRYKLGKIDPQWVETPSPYAAYTNVPPGKYLFEVTSLLPDGSISTDSVKLLIVIPPPFWKTIWFIGLIILLFLSGLSAYLYTYIRQLKLDRLNVQLEQRLLISQMKPHFIFNSLSAIQSFMYSNNPEEAGNYLSSFSRLVRLILENSRSELIPIKQEIKTLELYLMLQKLRFPDKFEYEIDVSPEVEELNLMVPPMLAQPFIENSIEHGILHMEGKGLITISIQLIGNFVSISVEDNGIGIEKSKSINKEKRLTHTSYATSITTERIKNITKSRDKEHGIKIVDLSSEGKQGTRVELMFPFKGRER